MTALRRTAALAAVLCLFALPVVHAQPGTVEDVKVTGLYRMTREAFLHAFEIHPGDHYDPDKIRSEFRKLWDLGLFEDIRIEAEDGPKGGKVLIVVVKERPVLTSVSYEDNKVVTRTQIEDRLKEREVRLGLGKPLDMKKVFDAEASIRELLAEKGYLDARVAHKVTNVTETSRAVEFTIQPGAKTRIRKIRFVGNKVFSNRKLKKQLKLTRAWRWYWPWSKKSLYHPIKWDQDVGEVRNLYQNMGYLDVKILPPRIEVKEVRKKKEKKKEKAEKKAAPQEAKGGAAPTPEREQAVVKPEKKSPKKLSRKKARKLIRKRARQEEKARKKEEKARRKAQPKVRRWVYLTVPVEEGVRYTTGEITVEGNTVFTSERLRFLVPLRKGMILSNALLDVGIQNIVRVYEDRGYLYASAVRHINRRKDQEKIADIAITVTEDKPYYVARIEFSGNTATQDRVLRRELRLKEGDLFSRSRLDLSKRKVDQLGYFETTGEPAIEPVEGENRVNITIPGQEKGRNEIQVGGGYSGLDGAFFTGYYSTRNFLGRGQVVSLSLQVGGRTNRYAVSFLEPWFLTRPISLGFSLFRRDVDYGGNLTSSGKGAGIILGRQIGPFAGVRLNYNYESLTSTGISLTGGESTNRISSLTPSYSFNKVNNPYRPSRGWSFGGGVEFAGGPMGGDTNFYKPTVQYSIYKTVPRLRSILGLHAEGGLIRSWEGGTSANTTTVAGIPRFQRFWLGGDTLGPRVFDVRTITPRRYVRLDRFGRIVEAVKDPTGRPVGDFDLNRDGVVNQRDLVELGGDRFFLVQAEYVLPLNEQVEVAFFTDVGNALFEDSSWGLDETRVSAGAELRLYLPVFPVPLRLIYGVPVRKLEGDRTSSFTFSIGRSF